MSILIIHSAFSHFNIYMIDFDRACFSFFFPVVESWKKEGVGLPSD